MMPAFQLALTEKTQIDDVIYTEKKAKNKELILIPLHLSNMKKFKEVEKQEFVNINALNIISIIKKLDSNIFKITEVNYEKIKYRKINSLCTKLYKKTRSLFNVTVKGVIDKFTIVITIGGNIFFDKEALDLLIYKIIAKEIGDVINNEIY